jgi:hypothetical protein
VGLYVLVERYSSTGAAQFFHCKEVFLLLYGCESWSLTLREEHRLRVFENRVLRRIFGHKRDKVM